ncbi:MAG: hypothetical protein PF904_15385 [Kiritimatiellae bacterium]|jgi:hypothetical protein|nr:hypothetical protein [Kiritimatiellia bacterium]
MARSDSIISGFSDKSYVSGPAITAKDLHGKVVLIEFWVVWRLNITSRLSGGWCSARILKL